MRIAILGAGNWGTALAVMASRAGHEIHLWARDSRIVEVLKREHTNENYLKGVVIPPTVTPTSDAANAVAGSAMILLATPSHAAREVLETRAHAISDEAIIVSATKGIEIKTGKRISEVVSDTFRGKCEHRFVCLSGPSFAQEVVAGHPTAIVAASTSIAAASAVQKTLSNNNLRIYTNDDVVGTELGGSVKNVMAIAAGMVAGLGFGTNSIAALITRGLVEMSRLSLREGGRIETMMGLAGLGDLVLTCTGALSRNRYVGVELGKGRTLEDITGGMNEVAEGVRTTLAVKALADRLVIEMPITDQVHAVLYNGKSATDAARDLMTRPLKEEL